MMATGQQIARPDAPAISVILATWDTFDAIRTTVEHVAAQRIANSIELIICAPSKERVALDTDILRSLHSVRVLETETLHGPMRAQAVREARGAIVAFAEDHCFPQEGWADALIAAHAEPHAAVGPAVYNANPESVTSWADLYLEYGRWLGPGSRRVVELLPGHNSTYKREVLLGYGSELEQFMEAETVLFWDLRRKGHTLLFEPAARVKHTNFTRPGIFIGVHWHLGRVFGATRAMQWSLPRKLAYAIASPAIPFIRATHVWSAARASGLSLQRLGATAPLIAGALVVDFVAQAAGAVLGAGNSVQRLTAYEFHRTEVNRNNRLPAA